MAARKNVLIMGAAGQLGRRACEKFMEGNHWYTMGADSRRFNLIFFLKLIWRKPDLDLFTYFHYSNDSVW